MRHMLAQRRAPCSGVRHGGACQRLQPPCASRSAGAPATREEWQQQQQLCNAAAAAALAVSMLTALPASAVGLESVPLPAAPTDLWAGHNDDRNRKSAEADDAFAKSDTLKRLLEKSEANKAKNKKAIQDKYCYRQAELGIGDCGGLSLIPGMTDSGKQKTPEWLENLLGVKAPEQPEALRGMRLKDLLGPGSDQ